MKLCKVSVASLLLFLGEILAEGWPMAFTPGARRGAAGKLTGKVGACPEIIEGHVLTAHGPFGSGVYPSSDVVQCWAP